MEFFLEGLCALRSSRSEVAGGSRTACVTRDVFTLPGAAVGLSHDLSGEGSLLVLVQEHSLSSAQDDASVRVEIYGGGKFM